MPALYIYEIDKMKVGCRILAYRMYKYPRILRNFRFFVVSLSQNLKTMIELSVSCVTFALNGDFPISSFVASYANDET
jgi:hypothetical protein